MKNSLYFERIFTTENNLFTYNMIYFPFAHKYSPADIELAFQQLNEPSTFSICKKYVNQTQSFVSWQFGDFLAGTWRRYFNQYWK